MATFSFLSPQTLEPQRGGAGVGGSNHPRRAEGGRRQLRAARGGRVPRADAPGGVRRRGPARHQRIRLLRGLPHRGAVRARRLVPGPGLRPSWPLGPLLGRQQPAVLCSAERQPDHRAATTSQCFL
ncbi:hypothetical protein FOCC_FOCC002163 [Frankliniella occidentalis]|nr:hypothetical protein FOCC_FOCC002163 [Frankliniella occidentalis]